MIYFPHMDDCHGPLPPHAIEGLRLFQRGAYFEAHEALERAWREEKEPIRDLYRGILQAAVTYLHMRRGNFDGAVKVYERCMRLLNRFPDTCRGVQVGRLRADLSTAVEAWTRLGPARVHEMDWSLCKPAAWHERNDTQTARAGRLYLCDRCGSEMIEQNCKIVCANCGNRFDCSDLNLYFDEE